MSLTEDCLWKKKIYSQPCGSSEQKKNLYKYMFSFLILFIYVVSCVLEVY